MLRNFNNPDAMVAALKRGEIDAAEDVPGASFTQLGKDTSMETVEGYQGAMSELAINGGAGLKKPHPALLDKRVRQAIGHAIDRETIVDRVLAGLGKPSETLSVSPNPAWTPAVPPEQQLTFDLDRARSILEDAGYKDTDGDGVREMPGGGQAAEVPLRRPLRGRHRAGDRRVHHRLAEGHRHRRPRSRSTTTAASPRSIGKGEYDMFAWGWTPFVDPDTMLSYFTCDQVASDPEDPTNYYNDANWCDKEYDRLYQQQKVELDPAKREDHRPRDAAALPRRRPCTRCSTSTRTCRRTRRASSTGFVRQPEKTGPVLFSNSSPSYARLELASASTGGSGDDGGGGGSGGLIAIIVAGVAVLGAGVFWAMRRRSADERE